MAIRNLLFVQATAQEICELTQQYFQIAYTSSTMDFFDKSIRDGALTPNQHSYSTGKKGLSRFCVPKPQNLMHFFKISVSM